MCGFGAGLLRCVLHARKMLHGLVVGGLGLHGRCNGCVRIAARNGAFTEQTLALVCGAIGYIEICLRLRYIQLRLLRVLWDCGLHSGGIGCLRLRHTASAVQRTALQVAVFQ